MIMFIIYSDYWASYSRIKMLDKDFQHYQVNHDLHFVDRSVINDAGDKITVHTNAIESNVCG